MVDFLDTIVHQTSVDIPRNNIQILELSLPLRITHILDPDLYTLSLGDTHLLTESSEDSIKKAYERYKSVFKKGNYRLTISPELCVSVKIFD